MSVQQPDLQIKAQLSIKCTLSTLNARALYLWCMCLAWCVVLKPALDVTTHSNISTACSAHLFLHAQHTFYYMHSTHFITCTAQIFLQTGFQIDTKQFSNTGVYFKVCIYFNIFSSLILPVIAFTDGFYKAQNYFIQACFAKTISLISVILQLQWILQIPIAISILAYVYLV